MRAAPSKYPAPGLVIGACIWAAAGGLASIHTAGAVRLAVFLLAAWPPVAALLLSMSRVHPKRHWKHMAAGILAFLLAATVEAFLRFQGWATPAEETVADLIYLAGYLLIGSGIWSLITRHGRSEMSAGLLDVAIMLIPPVVLLAEYVLHEPTQTAGGAAWPLRLLAASYPLFDVILLAALVWLVATPTLSRAHLGMLTLGMTLSLVVNMAIAVEVLSPDEAVRRVVEGLFPLTWTLLAAGVATGAAVRYGRTRQSNVVHWGRVGVLAFGAILGPLTIVIAAMPPEPLPVIWVALAVVATSGWIVWRMLFLARFLGVTTNQLARARQELQVQATHDPLTGLLNRAVLDDVIEDFERPETRPAALLSIDLDLFKAVNDTYGHAAGDRVLVSIADRLRASVRPADLVLRIGGDEFLVAMENVTSEEATMLASRIVQAVQEPIPYGDLRLRVAASVGVAMMEGDPQEAPAIDSVARADAAMYEAKRAPSGASGAIAHAGAWPVQAPGGAKLRSTDTAVPAPTTVDGDDDEDKRSGTGGLDTKR